MIGSRKPPAKQAVQCPACQHTQWEYVAAVATHCHSCGTRIPIQEKRRDERKVRLQVERKEIECHHCHRPLVIPAEALSWQCPGCSSYLDFKDHVIERESNTQIATFGSIKVGPKGVAGAVRTECFSADVAGRIIGRLVCVDKIQLSGEARLGASAEARELNVAPGARTEIALPSEITLWNIEGRLKIPEITADHINIGPTGELVADSIRTFSLQVAKGGKCQGRLETREKPAPPPEPVSEPAPPEEEDPLADYLR